MEWSCGLAILCFRRWRAEHPTRVCASMNSETAEQLEFVGSKWRLSDLRNTVRELDFARQYQMSLKPFTGKDSSRIGTPILSPACPNCTSQLMLGAHQQILGT